MLVYYILYIKKLISIYIIFLYLWILTGALSTGRILTNFLQVLYILLFCIFSHYLLYYVLFLYVNVYTFQITIIFYIINHIPLECLFSSSGNLFSIFLVNIVFFHVLFYALYYMFFDLYLLKFITILSIFVFVMNLFLNSQNILTIYIYWECIGVLSFLLISYYWFRIITLKAAFKALSMGKTGDFCIFLACILYFKHFFCFCCTVNTHTHLKVHFLFFYFLLLVFYGGATKSTQLGLHIWLPDAMEGPIPVSALIHAATLVICGIILILYFYYYFIFWLTSFFIYFLWNAIGILSLNITIFTNVDFKRFIAFSTIIQILTSSFITFFVNFYFGYYYFCFHMLYKSNLFISAGIWVHNFFNIQDLRLLFYSLMQTLFFSKLLLLFILINSLSLWFTAGFYIKEFVVTIFTCYNGVYIHLEGLYIIMLTIIGSCVYNLFLILVIQLFFKKNYVSILHFTFFDFELCLLIVYCLAFQAYFMHMYSILEPVFLPNILYIFLENMCKDYIWDFNIFIICLILFLHSFLSMFIQNIIFYVDFWAFYYKLLHLCTLFIIDVYHNAFTVSYMINNWVFDFIFMTRMYLQYSYKYFSAILIIIIIM